jgi:PAP_fibrillin
MLRFKKTNCHTEAKDLAHFQRAMRCQYGLAILLLQLSGFALLSTAFVMQGVASMSASEAQTKPYNRIRAVKRDLSRALVGLDRGLNCSPEARAAVLDLAEQLQELNPTPEPCLAFQYCTSRVAGTWTLLFSDAPDVTLLGLAPGVAIGKVSPIDSVGNKHLYLRI